MLGLKFMATSVPPRYITRGRASGPEWVESRERGGSPDRDDKYAPTPSAHARALAAQGRDIRLAEERIEGYRNFANKIWNAARLVLTNLEGYDPALARRGTPSVAERWIKSRLTEATAQVRKAIDTYRFNDAASAVYQFLWHEYCDWYLG